MVKGICVKCKKTVGAVSLIPVGIFAHRVRKYIVVTVHQNQNPDYFQEASLAVPIVVRS